MHRSQEQLVHSVSFGGEPEQILSRGPRLAVFRFFGKTTDGIKVFLDFDPIKTLRDAPGRDTQGEPPDTRHTRQVKPR
jgi:hypothetical protein